MNIVPWWTEKLNVACLAQCSILLKAQTELSCSRTWVCWPCGFNPWLWKIFFFLCFFLYFFIYFFLSLKLPELSNIERVSTFLGPHKICTYAVFFAINTPPQSTVLYTLNGMLDLENIIVLWNKQQTNIIFCETFKSTEYLQKIASADHLNGVY